ncbi:MAG: hypothetical protein V4568_03070 [Pseudomonadota bacterium]
MIEKKQGRMELVKMTPPLSNAKGIEPQEVKQSTTKNKKGKGLK